MRDREIRYAANPTVLRRRCFVRKKRLSHRGVATLHLLYHQFSRHKGSARRRIRRLLRLRRVEFLLKSEVNTSNRVFGSKRSADANFLSIALQTSERHLDFSNREGRAMGTVSFVFFRTSDHFLKHKAIVANCSGA